MAHPDFTLKNPNKVGALIGVFAGNLRRFHVADGAGYCWLADRILEVFVRPLCLCANCGRHSLSHACLSHLESTRGPALFLGVPHERKRIGWYIFVANWFIPSHKQLFSVIDTAALT